MHRPTPPPDAPPSSLVSWPNAACHLGGQRGADHLGHRAWAGKAKPMARGRCQACGQECSARRGTLLAGSQRPEATVERRLTCQRWGVCAAGTADLGGVALKTVPRVQRAAAPAAAL